MKKLIAGMFAAIAAVSSFAAQPLECVEIETVGAFELSIGLLPKPLELWAAYGTADGGTSLADWQTKVAIRAIDPKKETLPAKLSWALDVPYEALVATTHVRFFLMDGEREYAMSEVWHRRLFDLNGSFEQGTVIDNGPLPHGDSWRGQASSDGWSGTFSLSKAYPNDYYGVPNEFVDGTYVLVLDSDDKSASHAFMVDEDLAGEAILTFRYRRRSVWESNKNLYTATVQLNGDQVANLAVESDRTDNNGYLAGPYRLSLATGENTLTFASSVSPKVSAFIDRIIIQSPNCPLHYPKISCGLTPSYMFASADFAAERFGGDVYFACWKAGEQEGPLEKVASLAAGETFGLTVNGLEMKTDYLWRAELRTAEGTVSTAGSFTTLHASAKTVLGETEITLAGYAGATELKDFPVLVRVSAATMPGIDLASFKSDHSDLRFYDAAGAELPHEVEKWDPEGESLVWVRVPSLSGTNTKIRMNWGETPDSTVQSADTWNDDYVGVWHIDGSAPYRNSTKTANLDATASGTKIQIRNVDEDLSNGRDTYTYSGWYGFPNSVPNTVFGFAAYADNGDYLYKNGNNLVLGRSTNGKTLASDVVPSLVGSGAHHFLLSSNGDSFEFYIDGVRTGADTQVLKQKTGVVFTLTEGGDTVDEARLCRTALSGDWAATEYAQFADPSFCTYAFKSNPEAGLGEEPKVEWNGVPSLGVDHRFTLPYLISWAGGEDAVDELHLVYGPSAGEMVNDMVIAEDVIGAGVAHIAPEVACDTYFVALYAVVNGRRSLMTSVLSATEEESTWTWHRAESGLWQDPANWTVDADVEAWPNSTKAAAVIAADTGAPAGNFVITLNDDVTVRALEVGASAPSPAFDLGGKTLTSAGALQLKNGGSLSVSNGVLKTPSIVGLGKNATMTLSGTTVNLDEGAPWGVAPEFAGSLRVLDGSFLSLVGDASAVEAFNLSEILVSGAGSDLHVDTSKGTGGGDQVVSGLANIRVDAGGRMTVSPSKVSSSWYWPCNGNALTVDGDGSTIEIVFEGGNIAVANGSSLNIWTASNGGTFRFVNSTADGFVAAAGNQMDKAFRLVADNGTLRFEKRFNFGTAETDAACKGPTLVLAGKDANLVVADTTAAEQETVFGSTAEVAQPPVVEFRPSPEGWAQAPIRVANALELRKNLIVRIDVTDLNGGSLRKVPLMTAANGLTVDETVIQNAVIMPAGVRGYQLNLYVEGDTLYAKIVHPGLMLILR